MPYTSGTALTQAYLEANYKAHIEVLSPNTVDSLAPVDISTFVDVLVDDTKIGVPEAEYGLAFEQVSGKFSFLHTHAETRDYKVVLSGNFGSDNGSNDAHIAVELLQNSDILTGSLKVLSAGATPAQADARFGFTTIAFGRFATGDTLTLLVSKDYIGTCVLETAIISIEPLT